MKNKSNNPGALKARIAELEGELADLRTLYDITMEHGVTLENDLMTQNMRMETLQNKMRKYLSPQLFQALIGDLSDTSTKSHMRVKLTIYFSDVVGFSDLTDHIEPELMSETLNSYLTRMSEIALSYGGTVDKFIGDSVMVFFGAPEFFDDVSHAKSCARMALEMRDALVSLREEWKHKGIPGDFQIRAGMNTGICTLGNFGSERRMDYTIIGNQVNLTSRLQSIAPPDCIYVSEAAYLLIEDVVEARCVGSRQVKGLHMPVEVWELIGLRDDNEIVSPYLNVNDNQLQLQNLDLDLTTLPDNERSAIQKALSRALVYLSPRD
ncbi:MAG: adenylate/guanylate cyclase domain-containing protein [Chloroflexi bacterium]|nr:adenylate/guanylate cyclase domain-containing protein [Chloroflexota bacterium]